MGTATPEGRIKRQVTAMLKECGIWYFMPASNGYGTSGIPDIICIAKGKFVGVECKADPSKKPTALQMLRAEEIRTAGGVWFLVRSSDDVLALRTLLRML